MEKSLFTTYLQEQEEAFSGWDFSRLTSLNRFNSSLLPWSYGGLAYAAMQQANAVLDMGTGGGEFFLDFILIHLLLTQQKATRLI
ncbi:hypothetical protein BleG1_0708 [Shouchella lehensis G1]|uniref:Methyltransferase n=1 Tax=Shouchella lehensis G1 TaxID=1246626 RepID=A0A060LPQ4_9BACI|nr:hypothetical protein BleG1_0708 [Shouchella lehensis G1]